VADDNHSRSKDPQAYGIWHLSRENAGTNLASVAQAFTAWPTPTTRDWKDGSPNANVPVNALLGREVWCAGWPTPMAGTPAQKGYNEAGNNDSSRKTVALAGWCSPMAEDGRRGGLPARPTDTGVPLSQQVANIGPARLTASGEMLTGSAAQMASGGQLSPRHSLWLMIGPFAEPWMLAGMRVKKKAKRSSGTSRSRKPEGSRTE
jgi:hypothetical protein